MRLRIAWLSLFFRCFFALSFAGALSLSPRTAIAQVDPYKQHMENGVKLYQDKNYVAAIEEFKAAYAVKPKASPLQNIALCYKAMFNYPKAIAALETAITKHPDTMDASDKKAAEDAIAEMKKLLGTIRVQVFPSEATIGIDGEDVPAAAAKQPVPLGPGPHKVTARAEGYAAAEQSVTIASGDKEKPVVFRLVPDKGYLSIDGIDQDARILLDEREVGAGQWSGLVPPGPHIVRIARPGLAVYSVQVVVAAGQAQTIKPGYGGVPINSGVALPPIPPPPPRRVVPLEPPKRGFFALAVAGLTVPTSQPQGFDINSPNSGGLGGIKVGYRVSTPVALDLSFAYVNAYTPFQDNQNIGYTLKSFRLGGDLRLMTSGKFVRFVGSVGAAVAFDSAQFDSTLCTNSGQTTQDTSSAAAANCPGAHLSGVNAIFGGEVGIEFEVSHVLLGGALTADYQSTRGMTNADNKNGIFNGGGLPWLGGGLRAGYAFW